MNLKKFGFEIGVKFIGGVLSSWAIFSVIYKLSYRLFSNFGMFQVGSVAWEPYGFPMTEAIALAIGLTLLFVNFSDQTK